MTTVKDEALARPNDARRKEEEMNLLNDMSFGKESTKRKVRRPDIYCVAARKELTLRQCTSRVKR